MRIDYVVQDWLDRWPVVGGVLLVAIGIPVAVAFYLMSRDSGDVTGLGLSALAGLGLGMAGGVALVLYRRFRRGRAFPPYDD